MHDEGELGQPMAADPTRDEIPASVLRTVLRLGLALLIGLVKETHALHKRSLVQSFFAAVDALSDAVRVKQPHE